MIHLAGSNPTRKIERAVKEIKMLQDGGFDGALVENYCGSTSDVLNTLYEVNKLKNESSIPIGVNILPNNFVESFEFAGKYCSFIQLDYISGKYRVASGVYEFGDEQMKQYLSLKVKYPNIVVLGGVWPKYYTPVEDSNLVDDIYTATERADAVVVTGKATGIETPIQNIKSFREILGSDFPLIVGAGLNKFNFEEQMRIADGAIIGTNIKENILDIQTPIDLKKVKYFTTLARSL